MKINEIKDILKKHNIIITGPNMGGKTQLLLELLKSSNFDEIYFISCNNRNISILDENKNRLNGNKENFDVKKIVAKRIEFLENGIEKDVLGMGHSENISEEMLEYFLKQYNNNEFKERFNKFIKRFDIEIDIFDESKNFENEIERKIKKVISLKEKFENLIPEKRNLYKDRYIIIEKYLKQFFYEKNNKVLKTKLIGKKNGKDVELSTGIRALIRLFLELWIANENKIKEIYIDEVDMHMDQKNSTKLLEAIYELFPKIRFCMVAHNMFIISGVRDNIIVSLNGDESFKFFDSNDYIDLRAISTDIFGIKNFEKVKDKSDIEKEIDDLYNNIFEIGEIKEGFINKYKQIKENKEIEKISPTYKDTLKIIQELIEKYEENKDKNKI